MRAVTVHPCSLQDGSLRLPGDKSISHRLAMLCALADGPSKIKGFLQSEDCLNTLRAVERLGAGVERRDGDIHIQGTAGRLYPVEGMLDLGNSGTGMRLLAGILAGQPFTTTLTGDASLCKRPMGRIKNPLEQMGARVDLSGDRGCAPMRIHGGRLDAIDYALPVASAQVKSCVLLAALQARGVTVIHEPKPSRDHTERLLQAMGYDLKVDELTIVCPAHGPDVPVLQGGTWQVPGDFSSAAFFIVAAACSPGCTLRLEGIGLNPKRTALLAVLRRMGANLAVEPDGGAGREWEPTGTVVVRGGALRGTQIGGTEIPNLIDEIPILAVAGALAEGKTTVRDAEELRVKESDRIAVMTQGLQSVGVEVDEARDGMSIRGRAVLRGGGGVSSRGDHRVAMSLAMLALFADGPVEIEDVECVGTSYPGFWEDLDMLTNGGACRGERGSVA